MTIFDIAFAGDKQDMYLSGGDIAFADEETIVVQRLRLRLQFLFEEWFLNQNIGLPYTQTIFAQGTNIDTIYGLFFTEAKDTEGINSIEELTLTPDAGNRGLAISIIANQGAISETIEVTI